MKIVLPFVWVALLGTGVGQPQAQDSSAPIRIQVNVKVTKRVQPIFPEIARQKGIQGKAVIDVTVAPDGKVKEMQPVSGDPLLVNAFKNSLKKWRFEPQVRDGHAIPFITRVGMTFGYDNTITDVSPESSPQTRPLRPDDECSQASALDTAPPTAPQSGVETSGKLIHRVQPMYPEEARNNDVHGCVTLHGTIGKDGSLHNLRLISGPEELRKPALGAVEQWRYSPYLLDGKPVDVETTIVIGFHRGERR